MELNRMISNSLVIQLLKNVTNYYIKIFYKNECFNLLNMDIVEVFKDENFSEHTEEEFTKAICDFHGFKDNCVTLTNKSKNNKNQRNISSIINSAIQDEEDGVKRGALGWEEALF